MQVFTILFALLCVLIPSAAWAAPVIVPALGLTGLAAAVASVAINVAVSYVVNKLFQPDRPGPGPSIADPGVKQRIPSDTANKLPVIYGAQRMRGTIIFADISSNNQRMDFIIALAEGPVRSIGAPHWDDNEIELNGDRNRIFTNENQRTSIRPTLWSVTRTRDSFGSGPARTDFLNGNMRVAFYPNGGRCGYMEDFSQRWRANGVNRAMPNVAYVYVRLNYNRDDNVTGLTNDLSFAVQGRTVRQIASAAGPTNNTEHESTNPAECALDYLTNPRYGAGLDDASINMEQFFAWEQFCDENVLSLIHI